MASGLGRGWDDHSRLVDLPRRLDPAVRSRRVRWRWRFEEEGQGWNGEDSRDVPESRHRKGEFRNLGEPASVTGGRFRTTSRRELTVLSLLRPVPRFGAHHHLHLGSSIQPFHRHLRPPTQTPLEARQPWQEEGPPVPTRLRWEGGSNAARGSDGCDGSAGAS